MNLEHQSVTDPVIQVRTSIRGSDGANSIVVSIKPGAGRVQTLVQSINYEDSQLVFVADVEHGGIELPDRNVGSQPGSTFKAIILAEQLKAGHMPYQTLDTSASKSYGPNIFTVSCDPDRTAGSWSVNNVAGTNTGMMTIREATKQSINTGFTEMFRGLDVCEATKLTAFMGITKADGSQLDPNPSIALGSTSAPPLSMANAYATSASGDKYCKPIAVDQILDASSTSMAVPSAGCAQVMDQSVTDETTRTLRATSRPGSTAKDAVLDRPIAGKTGTTDEAEST